MNNQGIKVFLETVQIGDELSLSCTRSGEDISYRGIVTEITDSSVWVKNNLKLDLFEGLATPALEEFGFNEIWWYSVNKSEVKETTV